MERTKIVKTIGDTYFTHNIENSEFSYSRALSKIGKNIEDYKIPNGNKQSHKYLDLRFENDRLVILVECKNKFSKWKKDEIYQQLQQYVKYEKALSEKKIVAMLAETEGDDVLVWYGESVIIDDAHLIKGEKVIKSFEEYENLCFGIVNDKIKVVDSIKILSDILYKYGIHENKSQFVGTCLLALSNGLTYNNVKPSIDPKSGGDIPPQRVILNSIRDILQGRLNKNAGEDQISKKNKENKLAVINNRVLNYTKICDLSYPQLQHILSFIDQNIRQYINDQSTAGQDLLSLFFTTFNKYVGRADKNQAFTPDHICDFMTKAVGVNKNSRILDPCCGSGAFLVRAMTAAMDDCDTEAEREAVKRNQIFGIEKEEGAFGLASTNMLIHGDGNTNMINGNMFHQASIEWIKEKNINIVLMNPPYNAPESDCNPSYTKTWDSKRKEDPSKGLHFVEWIASHVPSTCKMAVLLPMQAAIGNSAEIREFKKKMLAKYTLDAVFSLPNDVFYPGASAVACCMIFDLSQSHEKADRDTFFGYYKDDNFVKRKGLGRVEKTDKNGKSLWAATEKEWLDLYRNKREKQGRSVMHKVGYEDEWLAEAYMETDYSTLGEIDFQRTLNDYLAYLVKEGNVYEP